jgi:23S rRNA G2445 N2-methylase RlmL
VLDPEAPRLPLVATCALGLEEFVEGELRALGMAGIERRRAAVAFAGPWRDVWRANLWLRTANRVLVELGGWPAPDGEALYRGARRLAAGPLAELLHPARSLAVRATASASVITDAQWAALKTKDGLVDGQRDRWGSRADVDRERPELALRLRLHEDRAALLLDTSGDPLDHRGYRAMSTVAPAREQLAAAMVLASGWDGRGPVVDPMCGSGTLLVEAAWLALGWPPGKLRLDWAFQRLPGFDSDAFAAVRAEPGPAPGPDVRLLGNDRDAAALAAARVSLERAGVLERATLVAGSAFDLEPPAGPGLVVVNPPHGARLDEDEGQWSRLGDLLKRRFAGWKAAVLAGGASRGKHIGLRPRRRIPVRSGALEARILVFELY